MSIKITIPNTSSDTLTFGSANTPTAAQIAGIDSGSSNGQLALYTTASGTSTERVRVDASGNVGVGTTPPTSTDNGNLTIKGGNTFNFSTASGGVAANATWNGGWKYISTAAASLYAQAAGTHAWSVASSGTAGNAITFTEAMRIDTSGNLLVAKTSTAAAGSGTVLNSTGECTYSIVSGLNTLAVYSTTAAAYRFFVTSAGVVNATTTTITAISDQRWKENICDLDDGLEKVLALKPRKFDWKEGKGEDKKNARGFIAQELETVFPDMVTEWIDPAPDGEESYKAVNANLIPTLVKAIQEQQALITTLTDRITALENK
jgi:hypothetical protein